MANLSTKFVTSFSELYFRPSPLVTAETSAPKGWFTAAGTGATAKVQTLTVTTTTASAGVMVLRYNNVVTGRINSFAVTVAAAASATAIAALISAALASDSDISTSVAAGVVTVTFLAAAGNSILVVEDAVTGVTTALATTVDAVDGTGAALLIPNVMEVGTLSNESTVIETPTFGEAFKGKLRGQLDAGQLDAQLYWAPRDVTHVAMREAAQNGTACSFGIKWKNDVAGTNSEYVVFSGFLSSFGIDTTFDDVAKASSTMIVDGALFFASDA